MIKALKGTQDILSPDVEIWNSLESLSREKFALYGYKEIRTPVIEENSLFVRGIGEGTDIVEKQMYSFTSRGGRVICLRPEETASVARAYIENRMDKRYGFSKLFYIGPMFRTERPQAGRMRQFHQIGVEVIGSDLPFADAEVILLLNDLLISCGVKNHIFKINSLGCEKDKVKMRELIHKELKIDIKRLCSDCQRRYDTNVLRVLDCKSRSCWSVFKPISRKIDSALCSTCKADFEEVKKLLSEANVNFETEPLLVRGLDYYTKTIFEVTSEGLGAQNAVAAGGRYDNLVSDLGGPKTGAVGFAAGIERIVEVLKNSKSEEEVIKRRLVFVCALGEQAKDKAFSILALLRARGITSDMDFQSRSLKAQMRYADKLNARFVIIIGDEEIQKDAAIIKDMQEGTQEEVVFDKIGELMTKRSE